MSDIYLFSARENARIRLQKIVADLSVANQTYGQKACVYATGSFGRLEAGPNSDLDLFIITETVRVTKTQDDLTYHKPLLNSVDEIKLKSQIISTAENNSISDFDRGGKFLTCHPMYSFTEWLGSSKDDYRNTLTGRMLMLLESKPLIGELVYEKTIDQVIKKYFRDYIGHERNFIPSFLFNDIIRMWRTFCVNYEFYRKVGDSRDKIKNLKLKFSRMLTCYSGIIYLMAIYTRDGCVQPEDVKNMRAISPTERLEAISHDDFGLDQQTAATLRETTMKALGDYSEFLKLVHEGQKNAVKIHKAEEEKWRSKSYEFGQCLSEMIDCLGSVSEKSDRLRRLILI